MDVYLSAGVNAEPTQFKNDFEFRKQSQVTIASSSFPSLTSFVAAVRVNGVEFNGNIYHQSVTKATFTQTSAVSANVYDYYEDSDRFESVRVNMLMEEDVQTTEG